jgi:hypothetical protein
MWRMNRNATIARWNLAYGLRRQSRTSVPKCLRAWCPLSSHMKRSLLSVQRLRCDPAFHLARWDPAYGVGCGFWRI